MSMYKFGSLCIFIILVFPTELVYGLVGGELTNSQGSGQPRDCIEQRIEKKKILKECNSSWKRWGVEKTPDKNELLDPKTCDSAYSKNDITKTLGSCTEGALTWPTMLATLPVYGLGLAANLGKDLTKDRSYILSQGTERDISRMFSRDLMRQHCKIAKGDENDYIIKNCKKFGTQYKKIDCNPFIEDIKKAKKCIRSSEFRRIYRRSLPGIKRKSAEVIAKQNKKKFDKKIYEESLLEVSQKCVPIINKYGATLRKKISRPDRYLSAELKNALLPNKSLVEKFNRCVQNHPRANSQMKQELLRSSVGWFQKFLGNFESFKCYNRTARTKMICQVASNAGVGGLIGKTIIKKLGVPLKNKSTKSIKEIAKDIRDAGKVVHRFGKGAVTRSKALVKKMKEVGRKVSAGNFERLEGTEKILYSSPVLSAKVLGGGGTSTYLVKIKGGKRGVFKPCLDMTWSADCLSEVAAYRMDKALGLRLVPETVMRTVKIKGVPMMGSFQKHVRGLKTAFESRRQVKPRDYNKQSFFDFIIQNEDRHAENYLVGKGRQAISIDHGLSFRNGVASEFRPFVQRRKDIDSFLKTSLGKRTIKKLKAMDSKNLNENFGRYLDAGQMEQLRTRIQFMIDYSEGRVKKLKSHPHSSLPYYRPYTLPNGN